MSLRRGLFGGLSRRDNPIPEQRAGDADAVAAEPQRARATPQERTQPKATPTPGFRAEQAPRRYCVTVTERGLWQCRCATAEGAKRRRSGGSAETAAQRITDGRVAQRVSAQCLAARRFVPRSCWLELSRRDNRFLVALGRASAIPAGTVPSLARRLIVPRRRRGAAASGNASTGTRVVPDGMALVPSGAPLGSRCWASSERWLAK